MNRREFASTALVGGLGVIAVPALAQNMDRRVGMMPMGPAQRQHGMDTLAVGTVALQTANWRNRERAIQWCVNSQALRSRSRP